MSQPVPFSIPADFVLERAVPTGAEIGLGLKMGWLSARDAVDIALAKLVRGYPTTKSEESLALLLADELDRTWTLLPGLETSSQPVESRERLWLFLALDWLAGQRADFADPYEVIEMLYEVFDHPGEVAGLVRWMPPEEGEPTGLPAIDEKWKRFLTRRRADYRQRASDDLSRDA